jgi:hypothetical protein
MTSTPSFDFVTACEGSDVPMHVDLTFANDCGFVYQSQSTRTIVLRFESAKNLAGMLELADAAIAEMSTLRGELLACDMRRLASDALNIASKAIVLHLAQQKKLNALALLTASPDLDPLGPEAREALASSTMAWTVEQSFEEVGQWLADISELMQLWLKARPPDFRASYAGSTYSLPHLRCTVLRASGDISSKERTAALMTQARLSANALNSDTFIFDTCASPQIVDAARYAFMFKTFILPLCTDGFVRYWFHVHSGDKYIAHEAPPLEPFLQSFNIQPFEVETMTEALKLLTSLRGQRPR